jgi:5-methyltetrahydrofolate--homocysteine methyltransferase
MLIIGEKINATRKTVNKAIAERNAKAIIRLATDQAACGADYIDVNGGDPRPGAEVANMEWLVDLVQSNTDKPICIDSADPQAIRAALSRAKAKPIVNSISLESERLAAMLPVVASAPCMVVALCMSDEGTPMGVDDRVDRAKKLVDLLVTKAGKTAEEIIVDPCFFPISADQANAQRLCDAIRRIRRELPGVMVGGGLSNCSFGLPVRKLVNAAMMTIAIYHGMNAALIDPCLPGVVATILAAEAVSGADEFCMNYITAHREGKLEKAED